MDFNPFSTKSESKKSFNGKFVLPREILDAVKNHAATAPNKETGGMVFGTVKQRKETIQITVEAVHNIAETHSSNTATHFGIEPTYAKTVLNKFEPGYTYLGNWHSHLGYGGPSAGDRQEVKAFFEQNDARNTTIDFIMDRQTRTDKPTYNLIVDVYKRRENGSADYDTYHVSEDALEIVDNYQGAEVTNSKTDTSVPKRTSTPSKQGISNEMDRLSQFFRLLRSHMGVSEEAIETIERQKNGETLILVPLSFQHTDTGEELDLQYIISLPVADEDEIYIDISSKDMTQQISFKTFSYGEIIDTPEQVVLFLKYAADDYLPKLLSRPLADCLGDARWRHQ